LLGLLAEFETREWEGQVWRDTFADYPVNRTNLRGARWNPAGVEALYVSLSRETALAEAEHQFDIQPLRPTATRSISRVLAPRRKISRVMTSAFANQSAGVPLTLRLMASWSLPLALTDRILSSFSLTRSPHPKLR
jgi:hypothetical protein